MDSRINQALENHKKGYNCAQAVLCTYCDLFGLNEEEAFKFSEGFGGGIGGMRETCGAVSAMVLLAGMKTSGGIVEAGNTKIKTYNLVKNVADEFKSSEGSIICGELLKSNNIIKKTCRDRIASAAKIIEKVLLTES